MDLYGILGVSPEASTAEIKRAYRRLARRYHPGVNPGDRAAEAMFRRISDAYETLVDPRRREQYDAGMPRPAAREGSSLQFAEFDFSVAVQGAQAATFTELFSDLLHPAPASAHPRAQAGADLHAALTVEFVDAIRGAERQVMVTRQVACGACGGRGQVAVPEGRCLHCHATGQVRWARGHMVFTKACAPCGGTGRQRFHRCSACGGHGQTVRGEAVPVAVPPGTADGARLRVPERGHTGQHGGRAGDLYVTVHVRPHPLFRREGGDLVLGLPVAVHEAVLGARLDVQSLDGPVKLRIPPGTQAGQRFRVSGRGVPAVNGERGDLVVEVKLVLPRMVDERSRELMREFGQRNQGEDVRRDLNLP